MHVSNIRIVVGIYDTVVNIVRHRNGSVTIRHPYIRWVGNTGSLDFKETLYTGDKAKIAKQVFTNNASMSYGEFCSYYTD